MSLFERWFTPSNNTEKASKVTRIATGFGFATAIWSEKDYETISRLGYMGNYVTFRCIKAIADAVASVEWIVQDKSTKQTIINDPVSKLLERPNPEESWSFLIKRFMSYYILKGDSYFERINIQTGRNKGKVQELYTHRPDRMEVVLDPKTGIKTGYKYTVSGRKPVIWPVDMLTMQADILHLKEFNPMDDTYGFSQLEPIVYEINTATDMLKYNKNFLQNQARPGLIITTDEPLDDEAFEEASRRLLEMTGPDFAGKHLILDNAKTVLPYGFSPKDIDYLDGGRELARQICVGLGVPPSYIGIPGVGNKTRELDKAELAFWTHTVIPYLKYIKGELNNWLYGRDSGLEVTFLLDGVQALAIKTDAQYKRANNSKFLSLNEQREMVGKPKLEGTIYDIPVGLLNDMNKDITTNGDIVLAPNNEVSTDA